MQYNSTSPTRGYNVKLTTRQVANINTLALFLETSVTDAQYDHASISPWNSAAPMTPICAGGHAAMNRSMFIEDENPQPQNWLQRLFRLKPATNPTYFAPETKENRDVISRVRFTEAAFGPIWGDAFSIPPYRPNAKGYSAAVTRREVIHRLRAIANGTYKAELKAFT